MSLAVVLGPLFAMVALTFALAIGMVITRRRAVAEKKVDPKDLLIRGGDNPWPPRAAQFGDAYLNVFELPVLFYVLSILVVVTRQADIIFVVLAWLFVLCRFLQAYVHTTSNVRKYRSLSFRAGVIVLMVMWVLFAFKIFLI